MANVVDTPHIVTVERELLKVTWKKVNALRNTRVNPATYRSCNDAI
jgi:hypothetical protein